MGAMRTSLVLTVIGDDRPGIVEEVSRHVVDSDANWEESWMAQLAGKFAGVLRVSVDEARADELVVRLRALESSGLTITLERSAGGQPTQRALGLELVGHDRPGIVREIAHALSSRGINIEELETGVESAPMSGEQLFRARARLRIPPGVPMEEIRAILEALAGNLMVDLTFENEQAG
jgi:glycine cleavage system regulatory protein